MISISIQGKRKIFQNTIPLHCASCLQVVMLALLHFWPAGACWQDRQHGEFVESDSTCRSICLCPFCLVNNRLRTAQVLTIVNRSTRRLPQSDSTTQRPDLAKRTSRIVRLEHVENLYKKKYIRRVINIFFLYTFSTCSRRINDIIVIRTPKWTRQ